MIGGLNSDYVENLPDNYAACGDCRHPELTTGNFISPRHYFIETKIPPVSH
jgi:hypothetical protein